MITIAIHHNWEGDKNCDSIQHKTIIITIIQTRSKYVYRTRHIREYFPELYFWKIFQRRFLGIFLGTDLTLLSSSSSVRSILFLEGVSLLASNIRSSNCAALLLSSSDPLGIEMFYVMWCDVIWYDMLGLWKWPMQYSEVE